MLNASYFDGRSATLHPVELHCASGMLHLAGEAIAKACRLAELRLAEPFCTPRPWSICPTAAIAKCAAKAHAELAAAMGVKPSLSVRWQRHWPAALAALALLLGWAAHLVLRPARCGRKNRGKHSRLARRKNRRERPARSGRKTAAAVAPERQTHRQLRAVLAEVTPGPPRHPLHLLVRDAPTLGPNALALPDGTIVITDQLAAPSSIPPCSLPTRKNRRWPACLPTKSATSQLRHSVRVLTRSSLTAAGSAALFGDFSAVAAGLPALLSNLHYSRAMETDADSYAIEVLAPQGLVDRTAGADLFEWLDQVNKADPGRAMPGWMRQTLPYASSHPGTAERIARLRAVPPPTHPN